MSVPKTQQAMSHVDLTLRFYLYIRNILARVQLAVLKEGREVLFTPTHALFHTTKYQSFKLY